jgi:RNA polymerase sigma-70 factor (ECF subfamily)
MLSTDTQFFNEIRLGNTEAFEYVFHKYYPRLCLYAFTLVNQKDVAEAVVENVFVKLWEDRDILFIAVSFRAYLYKAVYTQCLQHRKHSRINRLTYKPVLLTESKTTSIVTVSPTSSIEGILLKDLEAEVNKAVESLPEQCREVFKLCRYEEMQYTEIALHLNISIQMVKAQMRKAVNKLSIAFREYLPLSIACLGATAIAEIAALTMYCGLI